MKDEYIFHFRDEDRGISHRFNVDEGTTYYDVHREFVTFLSAVYGYDLHEVFTD